MLIANARCQGAFNFNIQLLIFIYFFVPLCIKTTMVFPLSYYLEVKVSFWQNCTVCLVLNKVNFTGMINKF